MLKKLCLLLVVLYFAVFSFANSVHGESLRLAPVAEAAATMVEYALPYPGVLPDSPIYFLKVWRDQMMSWIISDPVQKSFYVLLLADKRLAAGEMLINSGKLSLGVTTVTKAEDYFGQAVNLATSQKSEVKSQKSQEEYSDLLAKLVVAGAKHGEVLAKLSAKVAGQEGIDLQKARQNNTDDRKRIMELLLVTRISRRIFA